MAECKHKYIKGNVCADCGEPMAMISQKELDTLRRKMRELQRQLTQYRKTLGA